jgi:hypothetical protein
MIIHKSPEASSTPSIVTLARKKNSSHAIPQLVHEREAPWTAASHRRLHSRAERDHQGGVRNHNPKRTEIE